jgi:hypothetical protein
MIAFIKLRIVHDGHYIVINKTSRLLYEEFTLIKVVGFNYANASDVLAYTEETHIFSVFNHSISSIRNLNHLGTLSVGHSIKLYQKIQSRANSLK